jgi:hypothetical protein
LCDGVKKKHENAQTENAERANAEFFQTFFSDLQTFIAARRQLFAE